MVRPPVCVHLSPLLAARQAPSTHVRSLAKPLAETLTASCSKVPVYAKLFDRLTPEEVLTVGGACDEGVYAVEVADSTGPGQCEPGTYYVEGGGGAGCTAQAEYG